MKSKNTKTKTPTAVASSDLVRHKIVSLQNFIMLDDGSGQYRRIHVSRAQTTRWLKASRPALRIKFISESVGKFGAEGFPYGSYLYRLEVPLNGDLRSLYEPANFSAVRDELSTLCGKMNGNRNHKRNACAAEQYILSETHGPIADWDFSLIKVFLPLMSRADKLLYSSFAIGQPCLRHCAKTNSVCLYQVMIPPGAKGKDKELEILPGSFNHR